MNYYKSLLAAIKKGKESDVMAYLKTCPKLMISTFNFGFNSTGSKAEFRLGSDFRADFVILGVDSGRWTITFVELESPSVQLFARNNTPRKELNIAIRQVNEWDDWLKKNEAYARKELGKVAAENDMCAPALYKTHSDPAQSLCDPDTYIRFQFRIVIGRSSNMSKEDKKYRNIYSKANFEIASYDRLLEKAKMFDEANKNRSN